MQSLLVDNAKTQRCQGVKRFEGRSHAAQEFLTGRRSGLDSFFPASLPLGVFALGSSNSWFVELRVRLIRDDPTKQPVLYELALHGLSASFLDWYLENEYVFETEDAEFWPWVFAPEPLTYQWYAWYPWSEEWELLPGQTNQTLVITNVDCWDHTNWFGVLVTSAMGERMFVGPARLWVTPMPIFIPTNGPALRYPATIEVFGMRTNFVWVEVRLDELTHDRAEDLDILVVSPSGHKVILMSDAGGSNRVDKATLVFYPNWIGWPPPPETNAIPSHGESHYRCRNYGEWERQLETQPPYVAPPGPYLEDLDVVRGSNPNGIWRLYIYDDSTNKAGVLEGSWTIKFVY